MLTRSGNQSGDDAKGHLQNRNYTTSFSYVHVDDDAFQLLVMTTMVAAVKKGLRSKLEFARQEYISVLSQLVKAFSTHPRFSSMASLSHHEPEADFFENVKHIQLHRRTRAFRKLASLCAEGNLTQACIMNFILPLANHVSRLLNIIWGGMCRSVLETLGSELKVEIGKGGRMENASRKNS